MKPTPILLALATVFAGSASAASVAWTTSPGLTDAEVSTAGTQVMGYYFNPNGANPAVAVVNTVPFALLTTGAAPAGLNFNGSYNNPEDVNLYQVPAGSNAGLNQIMDGQNWGGGAPLTVTGLTPGAIYQLQFMISDDRPSFLNARNYDVSDSNDAEGARDIERAYHSTAGGGVPAGAPAGSIEAKIFTGTFTADGTGNQDIYNLLYENTNHTGGNSGSQVNALQVRLMIPEPATFGLLGAALSALALRRRHA